MIENYYRRNGLTRCPKCHAEDSRCQSYQKPIHWMRCMACGASFKAFDKRTPEEVAREEAEAKALTARLAIDEVRDAEQRVAHSRAKLNVAMTDFTEADRRLLDARTRQRGETS